MRVWTENIGSFFFGEFAGDPLRVHTRLLEFCAVRRRLRLVPAELEEDPSGLYFVLRLELGEVIRVRPIFSGHWILYVLKDDINVNLFHLDTPSDIVLVYTPILVAGAV